MSDQTKIEWTDATWNPLRGCSKVSEGCRNCYAEKVAARFSGEGMPYEGTITNGRWNGQIRLVPEVLDQPLRWQRPRRIFVNSMSDLFHENVPFDYIDQVFAVMALAPQHTFQILTKRPERMLEYMTKPTSPFAIDKLADIAPEMERYGWISPEDAANIAPPGSTLPKWPEWPLPNVWLGTSVENQKAADERIPLLLQTPAAVRFLSMEPLLGPVDLSACKPFDGECYCQEEPDGCKPRLANGCPEAAIDWVIVGGESGPGARPMHPEWVRSIRDQCQFTGVPFFFKQWGEWGDFTEKRHLGHCEDYIFKADGTMLGSGHSKYGGGVEPEWKEQGGAWMSKVGKKKAGRLLDGRTWDEYPKN